MAMDDFHESIPLKMIDFINPKINGREWLISYR